MAPQRNILTSPEEPAGRFRAHPQEAWVSYLLGSPPAGGECSTLLPAGSLPHFRKRLSGTASWAGSGWVDFLQRGPVHTPPCIQLPERPGGGGWWWWGQWHHSWLRPHPGGVFPLTANEAWSWLQTSLRAPRYLPAPAGRGKLPHAFLALLEPALLDLKPPSVVPGAILNTPPCADPSQQFSSWAVPPPSVRMRKSGYRAVK